MAQPRRLHKSRDDKMLSGVSGGMAEYFDIDPVFVRLGWVLSVFVTGGISILIYIVMVIVVPKPAYAPSAANTSEAADASEFDEPAPRSRERNRYWLGIGLVVAGVAILLSNLNILSLRSVEWGVLAAIAVIALGAVLLFMSLRNRN